jgi:Mitochondrial carrier protein
MPKVFIEKEHQRDVDRGIDANRLTVEQARQVRLKQIVAGFASGMVTKTAIAPLERVKVLLQVQGMMLERASSSSLKEVKYRGAWNTLRLVASEEGVAALWKGNGANCLRASNVYALKFALNDSFKDFIRRVDPTFDDDGAARELDFRQLMLAGSMAGLCQTLVTYPLDLVRTRLSLNSKAAGLEYAGIADCFRKTVRLEGPAALYKGLGPTLISAAPYVALQMSFYEKMKRAAGKRRAVHQALASDDAVHRHQVTAAVMDKLLCGAAAGIAAQSITFPGDVVRRRMQLNGANNAALVYSSVTDCVRTIYRHEGIRGFYAGSAVNAVRAVPGSMLQFICYDTFKALLGLQPFIYIT